MKHLLRFNEGFNESNWFDEIDPVFNSARDDDFEVTVRPFRDYVRVIVYPSSGQNVAYKQITKEIIYRLFNTIPNFSGRIGYNFFRTGEQILHRKSELHTVEDIHKLLDDLDQDEHDQGRFISNDCCFVLWIPNNNK